MRHHWFVVAFAAAMLVGSAHKADAGMIGMPIQLKSVMQHIKFDMPTLAPIADTQVCQHESGELRRAPAFNALRVLEELSDQVVAPNVEISR